MLCVKIGFTLTFEIIYVCFNPYLLSSINLVNISRDFKREVKRAGFIVIIIIYWLFCQCVRNSFTKWTECARTYGRRIRSLVDSVKWIISITTRSWKCKSCKVNDPERKSNRINSSWYCDRTGRRRTPRIAISSSWKI